MHRYLPAMFQTYGHKVAFVPVNDRPRQVGVSKYSNFTRALVGLYDLFGVSWLRRRTRVPVIREVLPVIQQATIWQRPASPPVAAGADQRVGICAPGPLRAGPGVRGLDAKGRVK